jgi:ABC-2 type transport system permease protein
LSSLIRSELLKLRTARSFIVLTSIGVGLALLVSILSAILTDFASPDNPKPAIDAASNASFVLLFVLMLGVLSVTTEYRHGSIASALLIEPDRPRLLAAKLVAASVAGAAVGLLATVLSFAIEAVLLPTQDFSLDLGAGQLFQLLAGMTVAGALMTALGVGVGALVRRQTPAIVGVLIYLVALEPILTGVVLRSSQVPFSLSAAMAEVTATTDTAGVTGLDDPLGQIAGGLVLLGWALAFAVFGGAVMRARDITD